MDWKERVVAHGKALGRATYLHEFGVGIDFEDGCDAFWVLPGEMMSTVPVARDRLVDVDELLVEYERIGRVRGRALHVIRHYLASNDIGVDRQRSGEWTVEKMWISTLSVGARLTAVARDSGDVQQVVGRCFENWPLVQKPTREQIEEFLAIEGPPARERAVEEKKIEVLPTTIPGVLMLMGFCRALNDDEKLPSPQALIAAMQPKGRIGQTLLRVAERLPGVKASPDLFSPASVSIEFDDGEDWFNIDTKSKELAGRIRRDGPVVVGDQLAEEFVRLNRERSRLLRAINQAAANRGWGKDQIGGMAILGIERMVHLGQTFREVTYSPSTALTDALRKVEPEEALREIFSGHEFAQQCVAALRSPSPTAVQPHKALLRPHPQRESVTLRQLDGPTVAKLDEFADQILREWLEGERRIWEYRNRNLYDPGRDSWITMKDWVRLAERHIEAEWPNAMAIVILLDADDPRGHELAEKYLARAHSHHEVDDVEVEIVWRYRHQRPEIARQWFGAEGVEDVPFAQQRAKLDDPVAIRRTTIDQGTVDDAQMHRELIEWARTGHLWSPPHPDELRKALEKGWRDVAEVLEENPYLPHGLLRIARRSDQFDEPGMLLAAEFLLVWSRLAPSRFLAQVIATGHEIDLVGLAKEAGRASAVGRPEVQKNLEMAANAYEVWLAELKPAMAIAWKRCRDAGVA